MFEQNIGIFGSGQMARALARGFVKAKLIEAKQLIASDPLQKARDEFAAFVPGARTTSDNAAVAADSNVVFLAVKPQQVVGLLAKLKSKLSSEHLLISIAAGVRIATLAGCLDPGVRLIRVMPNTPAIVGQCASGYSLGSNATKADAELVGVLLGALGCAFELDEKLLDPVTGLSGSGPAFVYEMIEALSEGGVQMGLPREVAIVLAAQTVKGAAEMVLDTKEHPYQLRDRVATPGGTTVAGLHVLEKARMRSAVSQAVMAATRRSIVLGQS